MIIQRSHFSLPRSLSFRRSVTSGLVAVTSFFLVNGNANAGPRELKALQTALGSTVPISTATSEQLAQAVVDASNANSRLVRGVPVQTLSAGIIAGEALKAAGSNAPDAGVQIASRAGLITTLQDISSNTSKRQAFAAAAVRTAGSGRGLNITQVPDFSASILENSDAEAIQVAALARASRVGAAAVLGGRASELGTDEERLMLARSALQNRSLVPAVQEFSRFIAAETTDSAAFAESFVETGRVSQALVLRITPGVVAGDPDNARNIVETILNGTESGAVFARRGVVSLARSVGRVADIEQIQGVGSVIAAQIATGGIRSLGLAAVVTRSLAQAIISKPIFNPSNLFDPNRDANKQDEIAELAASVVAGIIGSGGSATPAQTLSNRNAGATILAVIRAAAAARVPRVPRGLTGPSFATVVADVAGSVALTVKNSDLPESPTTTPGLREVILNALTNPRTARILGGRLNETGVRNAINEALGPVDTGRFEDANAPMFSALVDPETDTRNF